MLLREDIDDVDGLILLVNRTHLLPGTVRNDRALHVIWNGDLLWPSDLNRAVSGDRIDWSETDLVCSRLGWQVIQLNQVVLNYLRWLHIDDDRCGNQDYSELLYRPSIYINGCDGAEWIRWHGRGWILDIVKCPLVSIGGWSDCNESHVDGLT